MQLALFSYFFHHIYISDILSKIFFSHCLQKIMPLIMSQQGTLLIKTDNMIIIRILKKKSVNEEV